VGLVAASQRVSAKASGLCTDEELMAMLASTFLGFERVPDVYAAKMIVHDLGASSVSALALFPSLADLLELASLSVVEVYKDVVDSVPPVDAFCLDLAASIREHELGHDSWLTKVSSAVSDWHKLSHDEKSSLRHALISVLSFAVQEIIMLQGKEPSPKFMGESLVLSREWREWVDEVSARVVNFLSTIRSGLLSFKDESAQARVTLLERQLGTHEVEKAPEKPDPISNHINSAFPTLSLQSSRDSIGVGGELSVSESTRATSRRETEKKRKREETRVDVEEERVSESDESEDDVSESEKKKVEPYVGKRSVRPLGLDQSSSDHLEKVVSMSRARFPHERLYVMLGGSDKEIKGLLLDKPFKPLLFFAMLNMCNKSNLDKTLIAFWSEARRGDLSKRMANIHAIRDTCEFTSVQDVVSVLDAMVHVCVQCDFSELALKYIALRDMVNVIREGASCYSLLSLVNFLSRLLDDAQESY